MPELSSRADATANRLRLIQIEFADSTENERRTHLSNEIGAALKAVLPEHRKAFLAELEARFPTWDIRSESLAEAPHSSEPQAPPAEINDWTFLLQHLIRVAGELPASEKETLIERLADEGLVPQGQQEWPRKAEKELRASLKLEDGQTLVPERILKLVVLLAEFARGLESVWGTWREIEPRSQIKKSGDLQKEITEFLGAGDEMSRDHIKPDLDRLRNLIVGLTNSVALFGHQIAEKFQNELSPQVIKDTARKAKVFECPPAPWWEQYERVAWGPDKGSIERDMRQLVAENTKKIISGLT